MRGFTLIELLVVIFIVAVVLSGVRLSFTSDGQSPRVQAKALAGLWQEVCDQALQSQNLLVLLWQDNDLSVRSYHPQTPENPWQDAQIPLPNALQNIRWRLDGGLNGVLDMEGHHQAWGCWPSGLRTPGAAIFGEEDHAYRISWPAWGAMEIVRVHPA